MPKKSLSPDVSIAKELDAAVKALQPAALRITKALKSLDPKKLPVGTVADVMYDLRNLNKQLSVLLAPFNDAVEPKLKELEDYFINSLTVGESSGVQGMFARVQITEAVIPVVSDWEAFYKHLRKSGEFELLNRAVNRAAVVERWDAKKQVPGVGKFVAKKVSCTKLSGKGR